MSEWIEYTGSDEQNRDILGSKADVLFMYSNGVHRLRSSMFTGDWKHRTLTHYLICQPHPYADLVDIWRLSGCPVYVRITEYELHKHGCREYQVTYTRNGDTVLVTCKPDWNIPGAEYRLTPFED